MLKAVQTVMQLFYAVILLAASSETTGLLSGACLVGGILNIVSLAILITIWAFTAAIKEKNNGR